LNRRIAVRARYGFARAFRWLFMKRESAQAASIAADLLELERAVEVGWRDVALLDHNSEFRRYRANADLRALRARIEALPRDPRASRDRGFGGPPHLIQTSI
jgi:hypothetical protein